MAKKTDQNQELDSVYVLKIVLYLVLGSQWLRIITKGDTELPIPVGALIGLLFIAHDHFKIDRKVEYAVLLMAMFVGFWLPMGLELTFN
ncbi:hypothetical protein H0X09_02775 [Candidatus Saccharibacteria bacterium]|nr:hypothetical protein [Candidatus Saccharibacteria bacterium]